MNAIGLNNGIFKAREDKTPKSSLVARAQRAQVHGVDYAWRVFCYLCTPSFFPSRSIWTWRAVKRFFVDFFGFHFDNTSRCYLVFAALFPTL